MDDWFADIIPSTVSKQVSAFITTRLNALRHVGDAMADGKDKQKEQEDAKGRAVLTVISRTRLL